MSAPEKKSNFKYVFFMWLSLIGGIGFGVLWFWGVAHGMLGELPTFDEIENPDSFLATEIYSEEGEVLGKYYSQNRSNVSFEEIEGKIVNTLIATEDVRFYNHSGIDLRALLRAIKGLGSDGGGSTITQQLAKNLFKTRAQEVKKLEESGVKVKKTILEKIAGTSKLATIFAKMKEWVIAVKLEKAYTKKEIITMYLNTVEFSDNAFGIKSAARTYFNKDVSELGYEEVAVLIGMLRAPSKFNPRKNPDNATWVRNVVFDQLLAYDVVNQAEYDSLHNMPLEIDFTRSSHVEGLAPYFRETLRQWLKEWASTKLKPDGTPYNIYKDGLRIYTTIDWTMQLYAEEAVREHLSDMQKIFFKHWDKRDPWEESDKTEGRKGDEAEAQKLINRLVTAFMSRDENLTEEKALDIINTPREMTVWSYEGDIDTILSPIDSVKYFRMFLQTGFLAMDPSNGFVKAWVGGINYETFQLDHAGQSTKRQVGSTFKPFVYTLAIKERGYSPCFSIPREYVTFEKEDPRWHLLKDWTPKNSDGSVGGYKTVKQGLATSDNLITAHLMHELTPEAVIDLARQMGITSEIFPGPAIALGTPDLSLYEMIKAYSTFPNKGISSTPIFVTKIEDRHGNIIDEFYSDQQRALDEETAYIMAKMMEGVTNPGGTGNRIRFKYNIPYSLQVGAKTGTTQNNSDGWFMGYTPELIGGVWVGCEDRIVRFRTTSYGQGASTALPIWAKFMKKVYSDSTLNYDINAKFKKPYGKLKVELDCDEFEVDAQDVEEPNPWID